MGVVLTEAGARKLKEVVRRVEQMRQTRSGSALPAGPVESEMWGYITGNSPNGLIYSFIRVVPTVADDSDFMMSGDVLRYNIVEGDPAHYYAAVEANGARGVGAGKIVKLSFVGYREHQGEQVAMFMFAYEQQEQFGGLPVHDHRDNLAGGFSFSVYHPGTALPQQPWSN